MWTHLILTESCEKVTVIIPSVQKVQELAIEREAISSFHFSLMSLSVAETTNDPTSLGKFTAHMSTEYNAGTYTASAQYMFHSCCFCCYPN